MTLIGFKQNLVEDDASEALATATAGLSAQSGPQSGPGCIEFAAWWTPSLFRIGLVLMLLFEAACLATELAVGGARVGTLVPFIFNIVVGAAFLLIMARPLFSRHWRGLSLGMLVTVIASTLVHSLGGHGSEPLFATVVLMMTGAGALVPWDNRWQFALTATGLVAAAVGHMVAPISGAEIAYQWIAIIAAASLGHCMTVLAQRYRGELKARLAAFDRSHRELLQQIAEREAAAAQRERAQQQLRESEAQLRKVFDTSLDFISINHLGSGHFIDANREFVSTLGYGVDEVIGRSPVELGLWAHPDQWRSFVDQLERQGFVRNMEAEMRTKEGRLLPTQISAALAEVEGEPCVISVTRDITHAKRVEGALIAAREAALAGSEAKSEFVSNISHEIRTPMNAILGTADLLSDTALSFEQRHFVETIQANGSAMLALVNGVLDLARVESGQLSLERVEFDLRELVEMTLEALATSAHEKKLELAARIMPAVPLALIGDPMRLRQILINLLGNAIKFTERGEIIVTVEALPPSASLEVADGEQGRGWFRISVADTGVGIPMDRRAAIFAGFAQANSSTARTYGGSGLGLAIAKQLVELMGGRIGVESEVGQGSTFSIVVPFDLQTGAAGADALQTEREGLLRGKRVLIADDTLANRVIAGEWLAQHGAEVMGVIDGAGAFDEVQRARLGGHRYDVVVIDARMPGMDGITLAEKVLGDRGGDNSMPCEAMVLMLTSDDLTSALVRMREIGFDSSLRCSYVVKPLKRSELLTVIARVLSPIGKVEPPERSQPAAIEAAAARLRPLRILLAEDSIDNRLLIEAFLKQYPYTLEFAENGQDAIERVIAAPFDLVLMDIQMPVVDGYTAVRTIREWERKQRQVPVPIIALTASALDEAVRRSVEAGCDAHLSKPIRRATLIEAILNATASPRSPDDDRAPAEAKH